MIVRPGLKRIAIATVRPVRLTGSSPHGVSRARTPTRQTDGAAAGDHARSGERAFRSHGRVVRDRRPHAFARAPDPEVAVELRAAWSSRARPRRSRPRARVASRGSRSASRTCNGSPRGRGADNFVPLVVDGHGVGLMRPAFAADLVKASEQRLRVVSTARELQAEVYDGARQSNALTPDETARLLAGDPAALLATETRVTLDAVSRVTRNRRVRRRAPVMQYVCASRSRSRPARGSSSANSRCGEPPALLVERATASLLGIRAYGVHVNGYVCRDTHKPFTPTHLWVARRSAVLSTFNDAAGPPRGGGLPQPWTRARARSGVREARPAFPR